MEGSLGCNATLKLPIHAGTPVERQCGVRASRNLCGFLTLSHPFFSGSLPKLINVVVFTVRQLGTYIRCRLSLRRARTPLAMSSPQSFASAPTHKINVPVFVFHIDALLLSLFALYVGLTLPRALVRLFQPSEILNGFFLRSGARRSPPSRNNSTRSNRTLLRTDTLGRSGTMKSRGNASADHSTGAHKGKDTFPAIVTPVARRARGAQHSAPTRVPRWTTIVHPSLAYALNFRVSPGFSLGKLLVLVAYALIVIYACMYHSNPFTDYSRTGFVAVSQVPIVMALAGKSNWLSWLSGVGYEKVNIH